jgi:ABC-2 type transport system ATP-binding protein
VPAIELRDVSLWRRTQEELAYDLKRIIIQSLERRYRRPARRRVLAGVDLRVERGEKVGIIGPNGAGKSTLLKVICGILPTTYGEVKVQGSIAPLIELGAGFDEDLSVVENIIYYGVLLGYSRDEMRARVASILEFAELHDYARSPLKALSSGMNARLGFAIATEKRPDILILDEVLAVGDESFKLKSTQRMNEFWDAHCTILVVSHGLDFIAAQCDRAIWLDQGKIVASGPAREITERYLEHVYAALPADDDQAAPFGYGFDAIRYGNETHKIASYPLAPTLSVDTRESVPITGWAADLAHRIPARAVIFELDGKPILKTPCFAVRADVAQHFRDWRLEQCGFEVTIPTEALPPGKHVLSLKIVGANPDVPYVIPDALKLDVAAP